MFIYVANNIDIGCRENFAKIVIHVMYFALTMQSSQLGGIHSAPKVPLCKNKNSFHIFIVSSASPFLFNEIW